MLTLGQKRDTFIDMSKQNSNNKELKNKPNIIVSLLAFLFSAFSILPTYTFTLGNSDHPGGTTFIVHCFLFGGIGLLAIFLRWKKFGRILRCLSIPIIIIIVLLLSSNLMFVFVFYCKNM